MPLLCGLNFLSIYQDGHQQPWCAAKNVVLVKTLEFCHRSCSEVSELTLSTYLQSCVCVVEILSAKWYPTTLFSNKIGFPVILSSVVSSTFTKPFSLNIICYFLKPPPSSDMCDQLHQPLSLILSRCQTVTKHHINTQLASGTAGSPPPPSPTPPLHIPVIYCKQAKQASFVCPLFVQ